MRKTREEARPEEYVIMIRNAALLFQFANVIKQEERDLRVWMHSEPETSRVMDYIDNVDVLPELVVPLLKACKERYLSEDPLPENELSTLIHGLHDWKALPSVVSIIPSGWDRRVLTVKELALVINSLDYHYKGIRDELSGENWKVNSLSMVKAITVLAVRDRSREQESHRLSGGKGFVRPDVGHLRFSDDVAKFIIDNPDQGEDIVNVMFTRKTRDFDLISSIINSDAKALSSGAL